MALAVAVVALFAADRSTAEGAAAGPPQHLRDTGLFAAHDVVAVRADLLAFSPQYPLWSDGATKRRWIALPAGTAVDASRPDAWTFPVGTRLWKEFAVDGRRVETRFIERLDDGSWRFATYVWNDDQRDAVLAPAAGVAALPLGDGRRYRIPSESDCRVCHGGGTAPVLGFSALQLSGDRDPLALHAEAGNWPDLRALAARGWLAGIPAELVARPPRITAATPAGRAALGYLHGNCGHCHGRPDESGATVPVELRLFQSVAAADDRAALWRSLVKQQSRFRVPGAPNATRPVAPGQSAHSVLALRMRSRDPRVQMPPLGTEQADSKALALVERWIDHDLPHVEGAKP